jgi:chlorobactene glucosyltransferase
MMDLNSLPGIVQIIVILVQITALILLPFMTIRVFRNLYYLRRTQYLACNKQSNPSVSVLVPARNEADNITQCLESLAQQDYPNYEILVLDDQSTDNTLELIQHLALTYPQIRILHGKSSPPTDWNGKSYACHRLAEQANGDWLLFTDADTVHMSQSIHLGIKQALSLNVDLLSAMPYQITKSWSERVLVAFIMNFLPLLGISLEDMWNGNGAHAIANGQYLLVNRKTYQEMDGHSAIHSAMVDDFALANHFLQGKKKIVLVNGTSMLACRMYHNARDVWQGFSKNILLSLQTSQEWSIGTVILFAWCYVSLFVLPYVILLIFPDQPQSLLAIIWLIGLRLSVGFATHRPLTEAFFTVLSALGVMLLGLNAISLKVRKRKIIWKERPYPTNQ